MKVLHYYAKINENNICYGFETLAKKFNEEDMPSNLVYLPDYNESLLYKKYLGKDKGWSMESFEPDTDFELLERIDGLEKENTNLKGNIQTLSAENTDLKTRVADLEEVIASLVGGAM